MATSDIVSVGSTVWVFDANRRVYRRDSLGNSLPGGPIYREHFRPYVIASETSRSWVLDRSRLKVPKQGGDVRECGDGPRGKVRVFMTAEAVDADCWMTKHRHRLGDAVSRCGDVAILKQVAAFVGYDAGGEGA